MATGNEGDEKTVMVKVIGKDGWMKRKSQYCVGFGDFAHENSAHCLQPDKFCTVFTTDEGSNGVIYFYGSCIVKADFLNSISVVIFSCTFFVI